MTGTVSEITEVTLTARVDAVLEQVRALREEAEAAALTTPGTLLAELATLDLATRILRGTRDTVLDQARQRGASWNEISAHTSVAATTWRGRLDRHRGDS